MPRSEVTKFANAMEKELKENDYKGGWTGCSKGFLVSKLLEEVHELVDALINDGDNSMSKSIIEESADVANIAMMIADNFGSLKEGMSNGRR